MSADPVLQVLENVRAARPPMAGLEESAPYGDRKRARGELYKRQVALYTCRERGYLAAGDQLTPLGADVLRGAAR